MQFFSSILGPAAAILYLILLYLLIRGPLLRYLPLFLYVTTQAVTTAVEGWVFMTYGADREHYFPVYWISELLLDTLLFVLVISLTIRALEGSPMLGQLTKLLMVILTVTVVVPFVFFEGTPLQDSDWNNPTAQMLNFGAALMNLGLWGALIATRNRDSQLLTVSAGLGLLVAAAALTLGVREFTDESSMLRGIADVLHRTSQVASLAIWCWAFRRPKKSPPPQPA